MERLLERARDDPSEWTCLATDWSAPHFMPHLARTPKSWYTKKRLKYQVFGIRDYGANTRIIQPHFDFWPHDSNLHISFLFSYLRELKEKGKLGKRLMLQMDNCWKDNKNKFFLGFLAELSAAKWFKSIEVYYLRPGHSHAIVDRDCFKPLGKHARCTYSYWTPEEFLTNFVRPAFRRQLATVKQLENVVVWNWKDWMEDRLRNMQFHSFQRAFLIELEDGSPVLRFKKNIMRENWRGLKNAPENGLLILAEAHDGNDFPDMIGPSPLPEDDLEDLLGLSAMPHNMVTFWETWKEEQFGAEDFVMPDTWAEDFWLANITSESSEASTIENDEVFSAEERDIHVVHHPAVIPLIELTKGCIIAVIPDPAYYEEDEEEQESEPFLLAQILRQKSDKHNGSGRVHVFKVAWFHPTYKRNDAFPIYTLDEENIGRINYKNILLHNIQFTLRKHLPLPVRRKLLSLTQ